ncbi:hypothetical protein VTO73DRAFT_9247 [Trametes versicolor]
MHWLHICIYAAVFLATAGTRPESERERDPSPAPPIEAACERRPSMRTVRSPRYHTARSPRVRCISPHSPDENSRTAPAPPQRWPGSTSHSLSES